MTIPRRRFLHFAATAAGLVPVVISVLAVTGSAVWSQTSRTIKVVVPASAGGVTDTLTRLLAEQIGRAQGPTVMIENRPGAGTVLGTEAAARAAPDGNTVLLTSTTFAINPLLRKVNYRCADQLRANLPPHEYPVGDRRQQRLALPHAH